jgi:Fe-S cluster biogenesis protein NfuA
MKERIAQAVLDIQQTLQSIGANVELLYMDSDDNIWVRLKGPCAARPWAQTTFQEDIKRTLKEYVPEIKAIEAIMV